MNKKVVVLSQGCAANFGDGEQTARILESLNAHVSFQITEQIPDAFCLNLCTVKGNSGALQLIKKIMENYPAARILLLGCIPKDLETELLKNPQLSVSNLAFLRAHPEQVKDWLYEGKTIQEKSSGKEPRTFAPGVLRESRISGIINISEGCLDACTFCSTRLVKGLHRSAKKEDIVEEARRLTENGCKELWLTGQDTSCYGFDSGLNLAKLAKEILIHCKGEYKIRLGMGNPRHLESYLDEMLEVYEDEHIYKFIHLPVQSGSNTVLQKMGRKHTVETFYKLSDAFQSKFSDFTLSTDLIVGFPFETDDDFKETCKLLEIARPSVCNITRFVPREGTVAAKMKNQIDGKIKHERSAFLSELFQRIAKENNEKEIGKIKKVLTEKPGKKAGTFIARDAAYRPVAITENRTPGNFIEVKIKDAEPFALIADCI